MSASTDEGDNDHQDAQSISDAKRHAPRPRRVPKTRAAQAKADAVAELFRPMPIVADQDVANTPFDARLAAWFERHGWQPFSFQSEAERAIFGGAWRLL